MLTLPTPFPRRLVPTRSRELCALLSVLAFATGCSLDVAATLPGGGAASGPGTGGGVAGGDAGGGQTAQAGSTATLGGGPSSAQGGDAGTAPSADGGAPVVAGDGGLDVPPAASRGAALPYWEYEAEDPTAATTNGTVLPINNAEGQLTAEASGRTVVELTSAGQYVSFTLQHRSNSIVVRYSIPDAPNGGGITATLGLYIGGGPRQTMNLTSRYMYSYGSMSTLDGNPSIATKTPGGLAHHFFDEWQFMFPQGEVPAGTKIKIQVDSPTDTASRYDIDLVDFEDVAPPLTQPAGSISITDPPYGAVPGATDATTGANNQAAVSKAIAAATSQAKVLWIPPGVFTLSPQPANLQNVDYNAVPKLFITGSITIQGAGMWYSKLSGFGAQFELKGNPETGSPPYTPLQVTYAFRDFALFGDVTWRQDTNSGWQGFDGPWGVGSTLENVWIEHENVGVWGGSGWDFPPPLAGPLTKSLTVTGVRVRDTYADGINLNDGTSDSTIQQTNVRNSGDDSLVLWSYANDGSTPCSNDVIRYDTVQTVWHANCFALYGGASNSFENNTCADTANLAGMFVATDFTPIPLSGTTTILHNTLTRAGGVHGSNDYAGEGALMFFLGTQPITGVTVQDMLIDSPILAGIQISGGNSISNVTLSGITVQKYGAEGPVTENGTTYPSEGVMIEGGVSGSIEFDDDTVSGGGNNIVNNDGTALTMTLGSGNVGF